MAMVELVDVFTFEGRGGNPCPVVIEAGGMTPEEMRAVAIAHGHESGFVSPPPNADYDFSFRFWTPGHEMEMCGHATIGALWTLAERGVIGPGAYRIETLSGPVTGYVERAADGAPRVEITQPAGRLRPLDAEAEAAALSALGLSRADLLDLPLLNAATSRVKTLVPLADPDRLNALAPDAAAMEPACRAIASTGLYPFAPAADAGRCFEARQFPRASGYLEDAATGIAAAALAFGVVGHGLAEAGDAPITVFQGRAMGRLSRIEIRLGMAGDRAVGCLLGGEVRRAGES